MLQINIPISEFLDRALVASARTAVPAAGMMEYAAMVVVAARAADAGPLHDSLIEDWRSIDDVTGESIMVLAPQPPDSDSARIRAPREPEVLQAPGLGKSRRAPSDEWGARFWSAYPVLPPDAVALTRAYEPGDAHQARAGFTSSASEIARYFKLAEDDLPCLVIVSCWDRNLLVIGPSALARHGPYALLRQCMQAYGRPPRWHRLHAEREDMRLTQARLARELRRAEATVVDGSHSWSAQRDAVLNALRKRRSIVCGFDGGVVPLAVKRVAGEVDLGEVGVCDLDAAVRVQGVSMPGWLLLQVNVDGGAGRYPAESAWDERGDRAAVEAGVDRVVEVVVC